MILNFKQKFPRGDYTHFVDKIMSCLNQPKFSGFVPKLHTIREDPFGRWQPGVKIHFSTGSRTKNYNCFANSQCASTQVVEIEEMIMIDAGNCYIYEESHSIGGISEKFYKIYRVLIDGRTLKADEIDLLAQNDGFDSTHDFFRWFNGNFKGQIIHWTELKY